MTTNMERAPYACNPAHSRGRRVNEDDDALRNTFQRDRDRIVHSVAFRRLKYKTQVFVNHEGDHFRTRLTHSLEVSQVARTLAGALGLDTDLTEALALAHDLGHPPFGHAGEDALHQAMQPFGGFRHNEQTIRVMTLLERRYMRFDGMNLTWETLEGTVKHNGPLPAPIPPTITDLDTAFPLELRTWPGLEAQIASLADDIAYSSHDIDDGLRAGLLSVDGLRALPVLGDIFAAVWSEHPTATPTQQQHEAINRILRLLVMDLLEQTRANLATLHPDSSDAIRYAGQMTAAFSPPVHAALKALKAFLMQHLYRHWKVNRMSIKAHRVVGDLFQLFLSSPACLPTEWQLLPGDDSITLPRRIADYIAGMTDRYALKEHQRLFLLYE